MVTIYCDTKLGAYKCLQWLKKSGDFDAKTKDAVVTVEGLNETEEEDFFHWIAANAKEHPEIGYVEC